MKFDLHVHSNLSYDSSMSVDDIVSAAKAAGLSGVAITDHNVFAAHTQYDDFYIIPSCEFSTDAGHLITYFLKEPINQSIARDGFGRYFWSDICKYAHDQGALVFLAHPFAPPRTRSDSFFENIDGIEAFNSRSVHSRIRNANARALDLCKEHAKPFSAGSDAHCPAEIGSTFFECSIPNSDINSPDFEEKLKEALLSRNGRVFAGSVSHTTVLSCKRKIYTKRRLFKKLMKNLLLTVAATVISVFKKAPEGKYIDIYTEE